jgi:hypothetical protein
MSILDETSNFVRLYLYHVGKTEVPDSYHTWACLSLIAACVADRVWFRKMADSRIFPNLYVMLIGPPGLGKGSAINTAIKFAAQDSKYLQPYVGNITKQALIDELAQRQRKDLPRNLWLISPELGDDIPPGPIGEELLRFLTKIFEGDFPLPIKERTRLHGLHEIHSPCLNWFAGTTDVWLTLSLPKYAIAGGSFARIVAVKGGYDLDNRIYRPIYPGDREAVVEHLFERVKVLSRISGEFKLSPEADRIGEQWYMNRQSPEDDSVLPSWKRQDDFVIKISMLFALADDNYDFIIQPEHLKRAQILIREVQKDLPELMSFANATPDTRALDYISRSIRKAGKIPHFILMRKSSKYVNKTKFIEIIDTLIQQRDIGREPSSTGQGMVYVWKAAKRRAT